MKVMITGAYGFIGRNLIASLINRQEIEILKVDRDTELELINDYCKKADFVFHLAGINRPMEEREFLQGNRDFTARLLELLKNQRNTCPVMLASSIQAALDNPYGRSKRAAEELLFDYEKDTGAPVLVYRFPNVFGKWCKPDYNSVVATFCHNIATGRPIRVDNGETNLQLVYIDDVVEELLKALEGSPTSVGIFKEVPLLYQMKLGDLASAILSFRESRATLELPELGVPLIKKLYSTYQSYLPKEELCYPIQMKSDNRGYFAEFIRTPDRGQVSINVTKPGIIKGNHWHQSKNEKFLVVGGEGVIRLRRIDSTEILCYQVTGENLMVVDIPPGYTHQIENIGEGELITVMWVNEAFDPNHPDTYPMEV